MSASGVVGVLSEPDRVVKLAESAGRVRPAWTKPRGSDPFDARIERVVFRTRPGVELTANAYVTDGLGKRAAILMVHGHWRGAKQDPVVQARGIGAGRERRVFGSTKPAGLLDALK